RKSSPRKGLVKNLVNRFGDLSPFFYLLKQLRKSTIPVRDRSTGANRRLRGSTAWPIAGTHLWMGRIVAPQTDFARDLDRRGEPQTTFAGCVPPRTSWVFVSTS